MTNEQPNVAFNIGSQHGNVSNIAGDMTVYDGQHYTAVPAEMIGTELAKLRGVLPALRLDADVQSSALALLKAAEHEAGRQHPDPRKIARPLERMTSMLRDAGALAAAGAELLAPIQHVATWLGAAGQAIIQLL